MILFTSTAWSAINCLQAPTLESPSGNIVTVSNVQQLHQAIDNLQANTTVLIQPGDYVLNKTLYIQENNITLRGNSDYCDQVNLIGQGMEQANYGNVPHGIWSNASALTVQNLTIRDVYFHPIQFDANADSPTLYNLRLLDAGEQFIKGSSGGSLGTGVDNGVVEYTIMAYTIAPPNTDHGGGTGYTNGIDIHGGDGWQIRHNLFKNFHTPDGSDHLWNPAILMWNGSSNTLTENNVFIDVDRAIAYGLTNRSTGTDHYGGIIRNNMIYMSPGIYSPTRRANSDALIIVWDSPQTQVLHNSILTNLNQRLAIEFRFSTTGSQVRNNLSDADIGSRNGATYSQSDNLNSATPSMFINPMAGDLHLNNTASTAIDQVAPLIDAMRDFDHELRPLGNNADIGADEFSLIYDLIFEDGFE
ncbi:MAG: hypothetical protein DWP95_12980 [Proteobacteria bacterium]|nr:MAG: hypothetical protein DWP95_12980 [Pseudomonadota bacterium]